MTCSPKGKGHHESTAAIRLRWKLGDFVGRWISARLGTWIEGPLS